MTNRAIALLLLLAMLCGLTGCAVTDWKFPWQKDEPVAEEILPEPEPEPEPIANPDPLPETTAELTLVLNGVITDGKVYLHEETYYLHMDTVARLVDAEPVRTGNEVSFPWQNGAVRLVQGMPNFFCGSKICTLFGAVPLLCEEGMLVPMKGICEALGIKSLEDTERHALYLTADAAGFRIPAGVSVPVLMYHCISDEITGDGVLYVSPENMEAQLKYLTENGYTTIFLNELPNADRYEKPVILTVDDGYLDNYTELYPLLQKYGCKATIFVVTDLVDKADHKMTSRQLRELANSGLVSIQSHTASHPKLRQLSKAAQEQELLESQLTLTRITGKVPYALCYPYGQYNRDTLELVQTHYGMGLQIGNADFVTGTDVRTISRWYVKRATTMEEFIEMVDTQQKDEIG